MNTGKYPWAPSNLCPIPLICVTMVPCPYSPCLSRSCIHLFLLYSLFPLYPCLFNLCVLFPCFPSCVPFCSRVVAFEDCHSTGLRLQSSLYSLFPVCSSSGLYMLFYSKFASQLTKRKVLQYWLLWYYYFSFSYSVIALFLITIVHTTQLPDFNLLWQLSLYCFGGCCYSPYSSPRGPKKAAPSVTFTFRLIFRTFHPFQFFFVYSFPLYSSSFFSQFPKRQAAGPLFYSFPLSTSLLYYSF